MSTINAALTLPQPTLTSTASAKPAAAPAPATPVAAASTPAATPAPSTTVTLSPQALSAMAASSHPSTSSASSSSSTGTPPAATPAPVAHDDSVYESLKNGITTAVTDVGDAIAGVAHAVVEGVETTISTANKVAKGILEFPFAAVSKASDAVGAVIDEL